MRDHPVGRDGRRAEHASSVTDSGVGVVASAALARRGRRGAGRHRAPAVRPDEGTAVRVTTASARVAGRVLLTAAMLSSGGLLPARPGRAHRAASPARLEWSPVSEEPLLITDVQARVVAELARIAPVTEELGRRFAAAGEEIALVGGPVRDAMLGRLHNDLDFTTSARPGGHRAPGQGLGRGHLGHRPRLRHDRLPPRASGRSRSRRTAPRPTTRRAASPRCSTATRSSATSRRRDFTVNSMALSLPGPAARGPLRWRRRPRAPGAAHAGPPGGLLLRRPAADDAGCPLRRPAGLHRRARGAWRR